MQRVFTHGTLYGRHVIFCVRTQVGVGLVVPRTERHVRLFKLRTRMPEAIMGFHY